MRFFPELQRGDHVEITLPFDTVVSGDFVKIKSENTIGEGAILISYEYGEKTVYAWIDIEHIIMIVSEGIAP